MTGPVRILVDADACPVKEEVYRVAYRREVPVRVVSNSYLRVPAHPLIERVVVSDKFELRPGWKYIVSVGSVGQPRDYDPRASYTVFDTEKKEFEFKRVDYDIKASAEKIFSADLEPNFGHRLFIGV